MATLPDTIVSGDENQQIFLVQPTYSATGWSFADQRVLNTTYQTAEWFYFRNGGCGGFRLILKEDFPEADTALQQGWEIQVRIKLTGESSFTTWYRGIIKSVERHIAGSDTIVDIKGQGYVEQLANLQVQRRYPKNQTISNIVKDLLLNYIKPYTRIVMPSDISITRDGGIDSSAYVTQGPIHFECSILRALKFLAELQGSREFGIAADRSFYFRTKTAAVGDVLFQSKDLVKLIDAGHFFERANKIKVDGKQYGHKETLALAQDVTDITNYGTYEKVVEVPWAEHKNDALRWAENIIAARKGNYVWKAAVWNEVDRRLESNHPNSALGPLRVYGSDVSNDFDDVDIAKIHYMKGYPEARHVVGEIHIPRPPHAHKSTLMRAIVYGGLPQYSIQEELEDKVYSQIDAIRGRHKQFQNPNIDVTLPNSSDGSDSIVAGRIVGLYPPTADVTNDPVQLHYYDNQGQWPAIIGMKSGDSLPGSGGFVGEEFFLWSDVTRTKGRKYYWAGTTLGWRLMEEAGAATDETSIYKSADEAVSNTTLQDDNELTITLAAATKYHYRFELFVNNGGSAEGFKVALAGTVGVIVLKAQVSGIDGASSTISFKNITALGTSYRVLFSAGANYVTIEGTIETSTSGIFKIQWAQFTGAGASPTTVQRGSSMIVKPY